MKKKVYIYLPLSLHTFDESDKRKNKSLINISILLKLAAVFAQVHFIIIYKYLQLLSSHRVIFCAETEDKIQNKNKYLQCSLLVLFSVFYTYLSLFPIKSSWLVVPGWYYITYSLIFQLLFGISEDILTWFSIA